MKTCKCPRCGTEANFISAKPEELPSWPAGIPSKWPNATEHLIGNKRCLRLRLTRQAERATFLMNALGDFRCAILDDTYLTDEIREAVLERLDAAFSPVQEEIPGHDHYALPNKLIHLEAPTADTNHDWLCGCGHWNGPGLSVCATCGRTPLGNDPT